MSDQYVGQILLVPYNFAPAGFAFCQGQLLPISQNTALFSLLGTNYGGDGKSTFGLPNLQNSIPIGMGSGPGLSQYSVGETGGTDTVTLISSQIPSHLHQHQGTSVSASSGSPAGATFGPGGPRGHALSYYTAAPTPSTLATMNANALALTGGSQPHSNMMPYLVMNYVIALQGVFPPRS
jgi:microcystin-dependent protein